MTDTTHIRPSHDGPLPYDLPLRLVVTRHLRDGALVGWTLNIATLAHGDHSIDIKVGHCGPLQIHLDGDKLITITDRNNKQPDKD